MKSSLKVWGSLGGLFMLLALSGPANAATYTAINCPDSSITGAYKINDRGDIVGTCLDNANVLHGYRLRKGVLTLIDVPGATWTTGSDMNNLGHVVGFYLDDRGWHGYLLRNGRFETIQVPGSAGTSVGTRAFGINDLGTIVGYYQHRNGAIRGFILDSRGFRDVVVPQAERTAAFSIDVLGRISGTFLDADGIPHAFYLKNGNFTTIHPPGAEGAGGTGVNTTGANILGTVVGGWSADPGCPDCFTKAFIYNSRGYRNLKFPRALETVANGINTVGQIVGTYRGVDEQLHGYVRDP